MTGTIWRLIWRLALRRRRLLAWNVLVPALLLVPVITSGAAAAHRALVVAVFVTFFGAYGSCIPLLRDGMSGWTEKVLLTGYGGRRWMAERVLATSSIDFVELLPVNLLLLAFIGAPLGDSLLPLLAATALALLFANLIGTLVAVGVRALGEAALGCAVVSLFALHFSGVFRTAPPDTVRAAIEAWSPLRPVHEAWIELLGGVPAPAEGLMLPAATTTALVLLVAFLPVARRIAAVAD